MRGERAGPDWRVLEQGLETDCRLLAPGQGAGVGRSPAAASRPRQARQGKLLCLPAGPFVPAAADYHRPQFLPRTLPALRSWPLPATVDLYSTAPVTRKNILLSNCGTATVPASRERR